MSNVVNKTKFNLSSTSTREYDDGISVSISLKLHFQLLPHATSSGLHQKRDFENHVEIEQKLQSQAVIGRSKGVDHGLAQLFDWQTLKHLIAEFNLPFD